VTHEFIAIDAASKYTGLAISTLYKMVSQRRIPYTKMGRLVRFDLEVLDKWIKKNTFTPMPPRSSM
jgi:excisionase family DNA binding protein